ncbi:hypothetical protein CIP107532_01989 [Corynebacterium diphtheriae]|nr:hypothetical protein CIP107532_01989 [Corynebacterium diphtheriae]CAB0660844.1 hypothetical protein CIP107562_01811 [Corynebacterium diphtheriae]
MSHLIPLHTQDGVQAVMGRDLHQFLEVKTSYKDWFPRMVAYGFEEGEDFALKIEHTPSPAGMKEKLNHVISLDMAKEISMIQRTNKGKQARQYFIECEKRAKTPRIDGSEITRLELIQIAMNAETERLALEAKNEKLEEFQRNIHAGNGITLTDFSKKYFGDVPARKFFEHLYTNKYIIDQRGSHPTKYGNRRRGPDHGKPTAKGRQWLYSHDHGEYGGKRRLRTRVRPEREIDLRDQLMKDGLPINANALTSSGHFTQPTLDAA